MAELVKIRKRINKFKIGIHVSVTKTYFILAANSIEPCFYEKVVEALDNGDVLFSLYLSGSGSGLEKTRLRKLSFMARFLLHSEFSFSLFSFIHVFLRIY